MIARRDESLARADYWEARVDLTALFRYSARLSFHESVANHFSYAVSADGTKFLMNPRGRHFSQVRASELLLLDANDPETMNRPYAPDISAWGIHAAIHANVPHARCLLHCHPKYATVLGALTDSTLYPIEQNTMRFYERVVVDEGFEGLALDTDEGTRLAELIGNAPILLMANHGVLAVAATPAQAFDDLYYFERACETLVTAYSTGKPLRVVSPELARKAAEEWTKFPYLADDHLREIKLILDREEPDYRT